MTIKTSGTLAISDINIEMGRASTLSTSLDFIRSSTTPNLVNNRITDFREITVPSDYTGDITFTLYGGGGGGGGADTAEGFSGRAGNSLQLVFRNTPGAVFTTMIGGGGGGGASFAAGGGGGAGGFSDRVATLVDTRNIGLPRVSNGAWDGFLNTFGVWTPGGTQTGIAVDRTLTVIAPFTGYYNLIASADDSGVVIVNGTTIFNGVRFPSPQFNRIFLNAGVNTVRFYANNTGGAGGIGVVLYGEFSQANRSTSDYDVTLTYGGGIGGAPGPGGSSGAGGGGGGATLLFRNGVLVGVAGGGGGGGGQGRFGGAPAQAGTNTTITYGTAGSNHPGDGGGGGGGGGNGGLGGNNGGGDNTGATGGTGRNTNVAIGTNALVSASGTISAAGNGGTPRNAGGNGFVDVSSSISTTTQVQVSQYYNKAFYANTFRGACANSNCGNCNCGNIQCSNCTRGHPVSAQIIAGTPVTETTNLLQNNCNCACVYACTATAISYNCDCACACDPACGNG